MGSRVRVLGRTGWVVRRSPPALPFAHAILTDGFGPMLLTLYVYMYIFIYVFMIVYLFA